MSNTTTVVDKQKFSQSELDNLVSLSGIAVWEYIFKTKEIKLNDNWYLMLGYEKGELPERFSTFYKLIHPEDIKFLERATQEYFSNPEIDILSIQYRMKTKSGSWKWLRNRSKIELDENNNPIKWIGSIMDISRLKKSEDIVRQQNLHINAVVGSLSDIVYEIDENYNFINCWAPQSSPFYGIVKSYIGKNVAEAFNSTLFGYFKKLVDDTVATKENQTFKYYVRSTNEYFIARTTLINDPLLQIPHVSMVVQNITASQKTQDELEAKEANLNAMIQNTSDIFWAIDRSEKLIMHNQAFHTLLSGISDQKPVIGVKLNDGFLLKETAKRWRLIHKRSLLGKNTVFSKNIIFNSGKERLYEFHINPFRDKNNAIIGSVITGRDIHDIYSAKKQAEKAARLKSKFVSTISHEIRTPLNAILGTCHQLERANKQENLTEDLEILHLASDNLLSLINDVLDFTKLESGKVELKPTTFNFKEFLKAFNQLSSNLAQKKGLIFNLNLDTDLPEFVHIDKPKLHQILSNLISNAVKYTDQGKITLTIKVKKSNGVNAQVEFNVQDTGIGIPKKDVNGIFDSFTQSSTSYQMLKGGTGLGLSITKNLVILLEGKIDVNSVINKGSVFKVVIPMELKKKGFAIERKKHVLQNLSKFNILVAEDNEINAKIITRLLGQWKAKYHLAINGQKAIELSKQTNYDLILMDIQMPIKNGFEASSEIKQSIDSKNRETPIMALTAQPDFSFDPSYREGLFDGYILKPFHPDKLKEQIINHLLETYSA